MNWITMLSELLNAFNFMVLFYFVGLNALYFGLFLISLKEVARFVRRTFFSDYRQIMQSDLTWPVSVLVPAFNEEKTIVETVRSLLAVNYAEFEVIVINDGSEDQTLQRLIETYELRRLDQVYKRSIPTREVFAIYGSLTFPNLKVVDKARGGKPDSLNVGINVSRYPLFGTIDADSVIEDNALLRVIKPFMERPEETIAGGGIVRIINGCEVHDGRVTKIGLPPRPLGIFQVVEYLRAFLAGRVGWSALQSLLIISGAFGIYRKQEVIEIGGYTDETDTEDLELVVRLHEYMRRRGLKYRVIFVPDPVCWTECPTTFKVLRRQRRRWHRGMIQTLWRHRQMLFRPKYGAVGMFALPYFLLFETFGPFIEILGYFSVIFSYLLGMLNLEFFLLFLVLAILYGVFLSVSAVLLEEISFRRYPSWSDLLMLILFGVLENFGFRQLLACYKVLALFDVYQGHRGWGQMERKGFKKAKHHPEQRPA